MIRPLLGEAIQHDFPKGSKKQANLFNLHHLEQSHKTTAQV